MNGRSTGQKRASSYRIAEASSPLIEDCEISAVGIMGAGHLGSSLALAFLGRGLPREKLLLSTGGSLVSLARLQKAGLADRTTTNDDIAERCDIILIAARPQSALALRPIPFREGRLVVSLMAGVRMQTIAAIAGKEAARAMTSGSDSILSRMGIAAIHPADSRGAAVFEFLGLSILKLFNESLMDAFTAAVCLPAALAMQDISSEEELVALELKYPELTAVYRWVPGVLPHFADTIEREAYVQRMITPGGITDSIIQAINDGWRMREAFEYGMARAREIAASLG